MTAPRARALALAIALALAGTACGRYGPPVRPHERPRASQPVDPASAPSSADPGAPSDEEP